jgi:hypothetical protein
MQKNTGAEHLQFIEYMLAPQQIMWESSMFLTVHYSRLISTQQLSKQIISACCREIPRDGSGKNLQERGGGEGRFPHR